MSKKFLDSTGVSVLWDEVEANFITPDNLAVAINTIDKVKANIDSPALTGTPTAPTAEQGDRSTQIATTEFVQTVADTITLSTNNSAQVIVTITPAVEATVTLTSEASQNTFSATTDSAGIATINVSTYGTFLITYQSAGAISSVRTIDITTPGKIYQISATYASAKTYTAKIDLNNSNSLTCITYQDDAVGMTKGSDAWDEEFIFKDIKPCVFKDGAVNYYLNKNDFTKKASGEDAVLDGTDGDVMIEFPKFAYKIWKSDADKKIMYVSITNDYDYALVNNYKYYAFSRNSENDRNYFYWGAFKGSLDSNSRLRSIPNKAPASSKTISAFKASAQDNGDGYTITSYFQLVAIQCLYILKYGNLNGQAALGAGITGRSGTSTDANYGPLQTGGTLTFDAGKKMYYGAPSNTGSSSDYDTAKLGHVKFAGIEDFWGNTWEWIDGLTTDSSWNIITNWDYDNNTEQEDFTFASGLTANSSGWVSQVAGTTETGFMNITYGGSSTTYFADSGVLYSDRVLRFGGRWTYGSYAGPFFLYASDTASTAGASIGARLMYL